VTSIYLSVDGRRFPRKQDYEVRLDEVLREAQVRAADLDEHAWSSVEADCAAVNEYVRRDFERDGTRGLALFSSSAAGFWDAIQLPRPVRNQADVGPQANVLQLEALLETYPTTCVALVDFEKARLFLCHLGRIEERTEVDDDVPGRHEQGGWAQMRFQRHVDDLRTKHLKHVAQELFRLLERRGFDHLVLAGSTEAVAELERELHDYVAQRVRARIVLPIVASSQEVLERSLELDEELETAREREVAGRLVDAVAAGRDAVGGLEGVLAALSESRASELLVEEDLRRAGAVCSTCGRLAASNGACTACSAGTEPVPDVVEAGVAAALRQGCRVETVTQVGLLSGIGGIGAFLRF
jgi:peptide chain release factor subunit 1